MTSDPGLITEFVAGAAVSLTASWLPVTRLERVGARLGPSEATLGWSPLAADAPEITACVTALAGLQARIGAGVTLGSNVFNLAPLLGLAEIVSGQIALHRPVIALESRRGGGGGDRGRVCLLAVLGVVAPAVGLVAVGSVLGVYLVLLASPPAG